MQSPEICLNAQRSQQLLAKGLNGINYLEVSEDQRTLRVYLFSRAPDGIHEKNVRIEGGVSIRNIIVQRVRPCEGEEGEAGNCLEVTVDRPGDFSTYTVRLINLQGFDPRHADIPFSFKVNCPTDLDCRVTATAVAREQDEPDINYLAKDYATFRTLILDRLAVVMPEWKERHGPDLGMALVEVMAYVADHLSYYQDAVATEAYLQTARRRISVKRHVRLVDYEMHEGCNARSWLTISTPQDEKLQVDAIYFITGSNPKGVRVLSEEHLHQLQVSDYEVFEPLWPTGEELQLYQDHNEIKFYTWANTQCRLPKGATRATLRGLLPHLSPGVILIFEEKYNPLTGSQDDADPGHRHPVLLTKVKEDIDPFDHTPIVEIKWAEEDALPFDLYLSVIGPSPDCRYLDEVSVARGNVLLVDHGRWVDLEDVGTVLEQDSEPCCLGEGRPGEHRVVSRRFNPRLAQGPLTFRQSLSDSPKSATALLKQNPRKALPHISTLRSVSRPKDGFPSKVDGERLKKMEGVQWDPKPDLIASTGSDAHFVVEIENNGEAHLRFGNDDLGRAVEPGTTFWARYRVGNGLTGMVGPETILTMVTRPTSLNGYDGLEVRNPLPATGAIPPESMEDAMLLAPYAFRTKRERAITADDYARLAEENDPRVQRAAASLRWTGMGNLVQVAIDAKGTAEPSEELLKNVRLKLEQYRRIGHEVSVIGAHYVPLAIDLLVTILPQYLRGQVKVAVLDVLSNRIRTNGRPGFFHPDALSFGQSVYLSRLIAAIKAVEGVERVMVRTYERLFEGAGNELQTGVLRIAPLEIARLDNDPSFPEHGTIQVETRGGR